MRCDTRKRLIASVNPDTASPVATAHLPQRLNTVARRVAPAAGQISLSDPELRCSGTQLTRRALGEHSSRGPESRRTGRPSMSVGDEMAVKCSVIVVSQGRQTHSGIIRKDLKKRRRIKLGLGAINCSACGDNRNSKQDPAHKSVSR